MRPSQLPLAINGRGIVGLAHVDDHATVTRRAQRTGLAGQFAAAAARCSAHRWHARPAKRAECTPGLPASESTSRPESSASAASPEALRGIACLEQCIGLESGAGLGDAAQCTARTAGSGRGRAAPAARPARAACRHCRWPGPRGACRGAGLMRAFMCPARRAAARTAAPFPWWPAPAAHPVRRAAWRGLRPCPAPR